MNLDRNSLYGADEKWQLKNYICNLMINITFPDGNVRQYEPGVSSMDIAKSISEGLAKKILVAEVNRKVLDLSRPIPAGISSIKLITWDDEVGKKYLFGTARHI